MISITDDKYTIKIVDDKFNLDKVGTLGDLLQYLEYEKELDFRIELVGDKIFGFSGEITPQKDVSILRAFDEVKNAFNEIDEMDEDEYSISFELVLLK